LVALLMLASGAQGSSTERVLYSFQGGNDGAKPAGGVLFDKAGNLYGTTSSGGPNCSKEDGCGTVYQLTPQGGGWTETVLYAFMGKSQNDGNFPNGGLVFDQDGNLYGVTGYGGSGNCVLVEEDVGCGTVFELMPNGSTWTETILYSFQGGKDGYLPVGNLTFDTKGNLYGATFFGGGYGVCDQGIYPYCGTIFELSPPTHKGGAWTEKVLHSFKNGADGANPNGGLVFDAEGVLYGTTVYGGGKGCNSDAGDGCGSVFQLKPPARKGGSWIHTVLYRFKASGDGGNPAAGVIFGQKGALYGTTATGGQGESGTVFQLKPKRGGAWSETILYALTDGNDGADPMAGLIFDNERNLYGTASMGGASHRGTVFQVGPPPTWTYTVLYGFTGSSDGSGPAASLIFDGAGNLYGTTQYGGGGQGCYGGCGTVFEVTP
jgi:uncharacterized repeat protein (TIGR03803 family)